MKHKRKIIGVLAFCAAVFLVGCGEQSVGETSSSSVETSTSSVETSSSSAESSASSSDLNIENPMDINDVLNPELNTIDTSKPIKTEGSSSNSDSSTTTPDPDTSSSEPTSDTHEPTSEPTSSSQPTTSQHTSSTSNSGTTSSSQPTGETSKPTSSSSSSTTSKPSSTPATSTWNPDAPGNKPGPYGGYYDASGKLHAIEAQVPLDSYGYPVVTFYAEDGSLTMTKADKEARDAEIKRINEGGDINLSEKEQEEFESLWTW